MDIVETGATLKANGLVPIETVADVSARLIVNTASMKLYKTQILDFIGKCEAELRKSESMIQIVTADGVRGKRP